MTVEEPVEVTLPNQISVATPLAPNCTALVQVPTPPPLTDDTVAVVVASANTTRASPTPWGDTARVVSDVPEMDAKVPTWVMVATEVL